MANYSGMVYWWGTRDTRVRTAPVTGASIGEKEITVEWVESAPGYSCPARLEAEAVGVSRFKGRYSYPGYPTRGDIYHCELSLYTAAHGLLLFGSWLNKARDGGNGQWVILLTPE